MTSELWLDVLAKLGGGAVVLLAVLGGLWKLFQTLSGKWIDRRFEAKLRAADNEFANQLKETEQKHDVLVRHLQSKIDRELDRAIRLHTNEFDALSEGWAVLHEAYWIARDATSRSYEIHDLAQMADGQLAEFIEKLDFPIWQKRELVDLAMNKDAAPEAIRKCYTKHWRWNQSSECQRRRTKLVMFVDRKGIFMQLEIKQRFDKLHELIADALLEFRLRITDLEAPVNAFNEFKMSEKLASEGKSLYDDLEKLIHARLWSPVSLPSNG